MRAKFKGSGFYLIPSFIGTKSSGHWFTTIIQIIDRNLKGWVLDSWSGTDRKTKRDLTNRILKAFNLNLLEWKEINCTQQCELECGPRTFWAIATFCKREKIGIKVEENIHRTAKLGDLEGEYSAKKIREEANLWLLNNSLALL